MYIHKDVSCRHPPTGVGAVAGGAVAAGGTVVAAHGVSVAKNGLNHLLNAKITVDPENQIPRDQLNPPSEPGKAPTFKKDDSKVEVHHVGQNPNGPFVEMHKSDHRLGENYKKNHPPGQKPLTKEQREQFNKDRKEYWKDVWKNQFQQKQIMGMENLILDCENTFNELSLFSRNILSLRNPIIDDRLEAFERRIGYILPFDFKFFLKRSNGFSLLGVEVFGIGDEFNASSLVAIYDFEHIQVANKMPSNFLPFSDDGRGNHYCLDLLRLKDQLCPVVFWQWDYEYATLEDVETCNDNFISWVNEVMIGWTLKEYNYDGSEK